MNSLDEIDPFKPIIIPVGQFIVLVTSITELFTVPSGRPK